MSDGEPTEQRGAGDLREATAGFLANRHELMAFLLGLTRDPHVADDILQETWLHLERHFENGGRIDNLAAYCTTVAKHAVLRHWRRQGRERPFDERIVELLAGDFAEDPPAWPERLDALRRCLGQLSAAHRSLLEQRYVSGRTNQAIAEGLRLGLDALNMRLLRLRQVLRRCVDQRLAEAE